MIQPLDELSERVIGFAIEVHRHLGPGLLESVYEECLAHELATAGINFTRQTPLPITYKGLKLDAGYRTDLIIDNALILELKSTEKLTPLHEAQMMTYLRLSGIRLGLLMNFNAPLLIHGLKRIIVDPIKKP